MSATLVIDTPRVFAPLLKPARYKGAWGGRGSAKSWTFATNVLERCMMQPTRAVCIREVQKSLAQSVKRLIADRIEGLGLKEFFHESVNSFDGPHDSLIMFQGMQEHTADSIKSLEGIDIAWVEEAQSLSQRSLDLLRPTIRKDGSELWFSWNPRFASDPVEQLLRVNPPPDSIVVHATYRDNPWLPDVLRREIEFDRLGDPDKFQHIWDGGYEKHSNNRVFKNWRVEDFETPRKTEFLFGGDWGFAIDPTTLVRMWFEERPRPLKDRLFIDDEVYRVGCEIDDTPNLFDKVGTFEGNPGMARRWTIRADSARPETISYLQNHGYPQIIPAQKGPNSVDEGVTWLQGLEIIVHPRCTHTADELTFYSYKLHPLTGDVLPILSDKKNHTIDAIRYGTEPVRKSLNSRLVW